MFTSSRRQGLRDANGNSVAGLLLFPDSYFLFALISSSNNIKNFRPAFDESYKSAR